MYLTDSHTRMFATRTRFLSKGRAVKVVKASQEDTGTYYRNIKKQSFLLHLINHPFRKATWWGLCGLYSLAPRYRGS